MRSLKLVSCARCATGKPDIFNLQAAHRHLKSAAPALPALSPQPCPLSNSPHFVLQSSRVTPGDCTGSTWNMPRSFARNVMPSIAALIGRRGTFSMRTILPGMIPFAVSARKDTNGCWRTENRSGAKPSQSLPVMPRAAYHYVATRYSNEDQNPKVGKQSGRSHPQTGSRGNRFYQRERCGDVTSARIFGPDTDSAVVLTEGSGKGHHSREPA